MLRKLTRRLVLKAIHAAALRIHAHLHHRADAAAKECSTILASTTDPARRNEAVASLEDEMMQLQERHTQIVNILDSVEALQAK